MPDNSRWRTISAPGDPPGSRVTIARTPLFSSRSASILIWVDLPEPSPPSNVMNRPRLESLVAPAPAMSELLDARTEHPDHQFAGAIDRPAHRRACSHRLRGVNRRLHRDIGAAPDLDHADALAGLDRRAHRAVVDDPRDQLVAAVLLHHHLDRLRARKLHR